MRLRYWIEIDPTVTSAEGMVEIPDEAWAAMSPDERKAYKRRVFELVLVDVAGGGCEEVDEEGEDR